MKFFHSRSRSPRAGRWVGVALGAAALAVGPKVWREVDAYRSRDHGLTAYGERHGRAHIADGDSVEIGGARLRLLGIDAPELAQSCEGDRGAFACGESAKAHLAELVGGRPLACAWDRRDKFGRGLARCRAGSLDLGAAMVRDGWAVAYGGFEAEEAEARRDRRGLWAGHFEWPQDFRRRERGGARHFVDGEDEW